MFTKSWQAAGVTLAAGVLVLGATPALATTTMNTVPVTVTTQTQYRLGEPIGVTFELHNPTGQDHSLLVWDTPMERWNGEVGRYVKVAQGNRELAYQGRVVRRAATPDARSYRTVHAGETVRETVDLSTAFAFTEPGTYTVTLDSQGLDAAAATFEVLPGGQPRLTTGAQVRQDDTKAALKAKFKHMSDSQERAVRKAIPKADDYVDRALDVLHDDPKSNRYQKWFGKWTEKRYDKVTSVFRRIDHDSDDITYDGDCREDALAYVRADDPDHIWLCPDYWDIPLTGVGSQAGTLVHEESHFDVNGGTKDYAYGTEDCKDLAKDDPNKAVANADSYAFFVETFD
ncbi:M35 family metallo-endopeptidase [Actinocrispum wychmicini]|uniref:Peptidyl-Lys metalloendopeptidase n=1 Tax=Actinocrispum wychmicini TaxID=1213861 RepID=A0A4V2S5Z4_9PSEU|nr:M35 family metallo-endopeptidase [Actinocrispum wychmicini]TCO54100.1 peptidyl-Lys metalloendopeptidase [Actinocrispum wychmicini]